MHTSINPEEDVLTDVYNGWIGIAKDIDPFAREVYVYFPIIDKTVIFDSGDINTLTLAYACTTHKYQGSSAPCVIEDVYKSRPVRVYDEYSPTLRSDRYGLKVIETILK